MKKINLLLCLFIATIAISCEKLDNYDAPNETLTGRVIDQTTGEPIISEQPNGFRIKLLETSWSDNPQPEYFWGKADGTFNNTKIFAGTYSVSPVEGAFFDVDPQQVEIKGSVDIEFKVTPYLTVNATEIKKIDAETLEVSYTISRTKVGDKIIDARVFVSTNPNVGTNIIDSNLSPLRDLQNISDNEILNTTYKETIKGLKSGKKYYVRVGARTNNASKRYNFTKITEVD
jgi:hypothetical protein